MKKIIIYLLLLSTFCIPIVSAIDTLNVGEVNTRITSLQGDVPATVPTAPGTYDKKGYVGSILANIFTVTHKIKTDFILAFRDILASTYQNNIPKWNGQIFKPGTLWDVGNNIGVGTGTVSAGLRLDVDGKVGATEYCDEDGNNCIVTADIGIGSVATLMGSWQDFTTQRLKMTTYQNINSSGLMVNISSKSGGPIEVSEDGVTWIEIGRSIDTSNDYTTTSIIVPPSHYYRVGSNNPSIRSWTELVLGNTAGGGNSGDNSYGGRGTPDYQLILNTGNQITQWVCEHDIDLTDICGDGDGCTYMLYMNHKVDVNDSTRNIGGEMYFEDPLFSKNNGSGIYGHVRQSGGDYVFINGTGTRTEHMFSPWGWVYFSNHKNAYCSDISVNTPYLASEPYKFSFMTHPYVQTKLLFWD